MSEDKKQGLSLHQKMLKIADAAGVLQRDKKGYNYTYVSEPAIQAKVTGGMQEHKVMLYHGITPGTLKVIPHTYTKLDKKTKEHITVNEIIVSADTIYTWVNVENPEEQIKIPFAIAGQMEDAAQALGAALTYGNRYALIKMLQLAITEVDPDDYRSKQQEAADYEENKEKKLLQEKIDELMIIGKGLMDAGVKVGDIQEIITKYNDGNPNGRSIKTIEICDTIIKEITKLKPKQEKNK